MIVPPVPVLKTIYVSQTRYQTPSVRLDCCFLSSCPERFYGIQKRALHLELVGIGFESQLCDLESLLYPEALNFSFCSMGVINVPASYWSVVKNKQ